MVRTLSTDPAGRHGRILVLVVAILAVLGTLLTGPAAAQEDDTTDADQPGAETSEEGGEAPTEAELAETRQLQEGQQVYSQVCSSCHQPSGAGLPGQFPPLLDNERIDDAAYVRDVIVNGLQGEIVVAGETYDGVMPSFSTLPDDEIDALIAYLQADLEAPSDEAAAPVPGSGPVAGTELPGLASLGAIIAYLLAAGVAALVLAPRLLSVNDRLSVPWLDAWLKMAVIVLAVAFLVVIVPDWALKLDAVTKLGRSAQDAIGTGLWMAGVAIVLVGLWYAHRESRV